MALIQCYECGKDVSERAKACPHCGAPAMAVTNTGRTQRSKGVVSNDGFYILDGEERSGPFSLDEMREMYLAGRIADETAYVRGGMADSAPVERIFKELFPNAPKPAKASSLCQVGGAASSRHSSASRTNAPNSKVLTVAECFVAGCLVLVILFCLISGIAYFAETPGERDAREARSEESSAYGAAERFIKAQFPGAKSVSPESESVIDRKGGNYVVTVNVDGLNAFGGPVRNAIRVELRKNGESWELMKIRRSGDE